MHWFSPVQGSKAGREEVTHAEGAACAWRYSPHQLTKWLSVRVAACDASQVSNEKIIVDLSRAEEAMLESRKRKRLSKDTKESRGKAVRAKTNGNMRGREAAHQSQPPRADAVSGSEAQDSHVTGPNAGSSASEVPEQASEPALSILAPAGAALEVSTVATKSAPQAYAPAAEQRSGDGKAFQVLALPSAEARGHTGYLTFARRLVEFTEP